ncbi:ABC transporter family protein [Tritrichomonas foetus]|uniref:ABC transporter family protein n=1 Tax=Tritrichomonas foetus TaxID=1144522 RepID=A0A1J4KHL8_9EUKA|nr:ABC transporter family protein [Tritrichomonas foetus]|eukprot:OHT09324.1 ABC transporter family protein [Tritrichomonas foetus]
MLNKVISILIEFLKSQIQNFLIHFFRDLSTSPSNISMTSDESSQNILDTQKNLFLRVMKYNTKKFVWVFHFIASFSLGIIPILMNIFLGDLINVLNSSDVEDLMPQLNSVIYNMIGYWAGVVISNFVVYSVRYYAYSNLMEDLRGALFKHYIYHDISFFDKTSTDAMIGRLSQDITLLYSVYVETVGMTIHCYSQTLTGIIVCFIICWQIGLVACGALAIVVVVYLYGEKMMANLWVTSNDASTRSSEKAEEVISSFRTVKSFDCEKYETHEYSKNLKAMQDVADKSSNIQGAKDGIIQFIVSGMVAGLTYWASYLVIDQPSKGLNTGDLVKLLMSLLYASQSITGSFGFTDGFKKVRVSAARFLEAIGDEPKVDQKKGKKINPKKIKGKIEFRNVSFKYESNTEKYAVKNLSFVINAGETVAFVGESGCGKTTTLQLLQKFYEIEEGQILIDDIDIHKYSSQSVRSIISIVPQGPVLYSMSIADNIRFARPKAAEDEVIEAARAGNAHSFIMEIPDQYESKVQPSSLSGGQKQRICISRAILANTPILLLDEATAALDTESEELVQQSLEQVRQGKTAIIVAHRLATVINADRILVFKEGHVEEEGTHQELLAKNGLYSNLVKFQLL